MLAIIYSCALVGLEGHIVEVQVDYSPSGLPSFTVVGLPDTAVQESRERIRAAIKNTNFATNQRLRGGKSQEMNWLGTQFEGQSQRENDQSHSGLRWNNQRYIVNLAPADLRKEGPAYDLPMAVGVLCATDQLPIPTTEGAVFLGELGLDGRVRHVRGILSMVHKAWESGFERAYVPADDASQAALVPDIEIIPVETLGQLVEHLYDLNVIPPYNRDSSGLYGESQLMQGLVDFQDIKGQEHVKRGLEVSAAGSHNVLMVGSPGVGKTLLARALPGILPQMAISEALEVTRIYSVADLLPSDHPLIQSRPFRAPHHTISEAGLVGGGSYPRPGEITLAHRGILFLDEFLEFGTHTLEVLRQPIEDKFVTISRAKVALTFPASFMLIAAMNPCPCGYLGDPVHRCTCSDSMIRNYQKRISGPLLDRIDIHLDVPRVDYDKLTDARRGEPSAHVQNRVETARARQRERFKNSPRLHSNADMGASEIRDYCEMQPDAEKLINATLRQMQLSARAYHRILKLSRTIADLADHDRIEVVDMAEAIQYRLRRLNV